MKDSNVDAPIRSPAALNTVFGYCVRSCFTAPDISAPPSVAACASQLIAGLRGFTSSRPWKSLVPSTWMVTGAPWACVVPATAATLAAVTAASATPAIQVLLCVPTESLRSP